MLLQSGAQTGPHHRVGGHRAVTQVQAARRAVLLLLPWELRAHTRHPGPEQVGSPSPGTGRLLCSIRALCPASLRSKPGAGEEAGLCPPAHRSLAGSSGGRTATPPHQGHLGPLLIKLKRPHASIPQDLPIKVFWCGSKLNHSYLAGTVEALTSQQLKGFWLAPFPLKHACWL